VNASIRSPLRTPHWPALLVWRGASPDRGVLLAIVARVRKRARSTTVALLQEAILLLHPSAGESAVPNHVLARLNEIAAVARALWPEGGAQVLVADRDSSDQDLRSAIVELQAASRFCPPGQVLSVVRFGRLGLDRLFGAISPHAANQFASDWLGRIVAWDREHGTSLLAVLEAELAFPHSHIEAANHCFMHRNTFAKRLELVRDLIDGDLNDPETRLALQVSLKLHHAREYREDAVDLKTENPRRIPATGAGGACEGSMSADVPTSVAPLR
jgi:sugar diacid utilization regulator